MVFLVSSRTLKLLTRSTFSLFPNVTYTQAILNFVSVRINVHPTPLLTRRHIISLSLSPILAWNETNVSKHVGQKYPPESSTLLSHTLLTNDEEQAGTQEDKCREEDI